MNDSHAGHRFGAAAGLLIAARFVAVLVAAPAVAATQAGSTPPEAYPDPPQVLFKDLFVAVQTQAIYQDGKAFADATADAAPDEILAQYHAARPDSAAALKRFVDTHFLLSGQASSAASPPAQVGIVAHIDALWDTLTTTLRGPGRPLSRDLLLGFLLHHARSG